MKISNNCFVSLDYKLFDGAGNMLDSSEGVGPLNYIHGEGHILPGLEDALEGLGVNEDHVIDLAPEQAYGERSDDLVQQIPREYFQVPGELEVGMQFEVEADDGGVILATVINVEDDLVTIDGNHPLVDQSLKFEVKILEVRESTDGDKVAMMEELNDSHGHGCGGHDHGSGGCCSESSGGNCGSGGCCGH